ncbi:hypothetical protein N5V81_13820 [Escherichia coli]|nr:hypothetical protein [Escherichia coli]
MGEPPDSLIDMGRSTMTESEAYYLIPKPALKPLNECYIAAGTRTGNTDDFEAYLKAHFTPDVFTTGNVAGGQNVLAVRYAPTCIETVYDVISPTWDTHETITRPASVIRRISDPKRW